MNIEEMERQLQNEQFAMEQAAVRFRAAELEYYQAGDRVARLGSQIVRAKIENYK
jgi:hypothetical protein